MALLKRMLSDALELFSLAVFLTFICLAAGVMTGVI